MNTCSYSQKTFEARESIWTVIEENSLKEERSEMKTMIGRSLIEETQDLHEEVKTLLEIWRNYRHDTDQINQSHCLVDPPHVRETLVMQIKMFIRLFQEKASNYERNLSRILSPNQTAMVNEISKDKDESSDVIKRPASAFSYPDREQTPIRPSSSSSGRASSASSRLSDYFQTSQQQKDLDEIENLAEVIREEIEQERIALFDDISFLQQCLVDESSYRQSMTRGTREPSLKDLKEIGLKLEKEILQKKNPVVEKDNARTGQSISKLESRIKNDSSKSISEVHRRLIPSPPSSAPTTKVRSHVNHRRQIVAKTYSFPSESNFDANRSGSEHLRRSPIGTQGSTTANVPCVTGVAGSNSRKLRNMVLECKDHS